MLRCAALHKSRVLNGVRGMRHAWASSPQAHRRCSYAFSAGRAAETYGTLRKFRGKWELITCASEAAFCAELAAARCARRGRPLYGQDATCNMRMRNRRDVAASTW